MKRLIILLLIGWIIFPSAMYSQDIDLTKLPKEEREKLLFEIASKAMQKYAPSYYSADIKPIVGAEGTIQNKNDEDYGEASISG